MSRLASSRRRGLTLMDVIAASSLGVVLVGVTCAEVARQHRDLRAARADARAQSALQAASERLMDGALSPPSPGPAVELSPGPLAVSAARADAELDPRLAERGLIPVRLRAEWRDDGGRPTSRELLVVVRPGVTR
jgi:hypothetical protein